MTINIIDKKFILQIILNIWIDMQDNKFMHVATLNHLQKKKIKQKNFHP